MKNLIELTDEDLKFVLDQDTVYENLLSDYVTSVLQEVEITVTNSDLFQYLKYEQY